MKTAALAAVVGACLAACQYTPRPLEAADADPNRPDADRTDADPQARPDARELPDAPPGTPDAPPDLPDAFVAQCPASYAAVGGSHYRWVSSGSNWLAAEHDCEDDAAANEIPTHLAVVDTAAEKSTLISGSGSTRDNQWLGLTDLATEGALIYVTPQAAVDPPTGASGNSPMKDCTRLQSSGTYQIRNCTDANVYVCECDGFTADPSRFPNYPDGN
jgi:hypothetical protein